MDISFKCPNCRQDLEVDLSAAGQQFSCPTCAKLVTVPQPDAANMKIGLASNTSAAAKEEKHFSVPVSSGPSAPLIKKSAAPLEVVAAASTTGPRQLHIKTIRHIDCKEVGHDNFDKVVTDALGKIGEEAIVSINTINYSYVEMGSQKLLNDFGVLIVYKS
ncbi:MAG TPA: hypothetical protein VMB21_09405 [Candidatus Limnocylindria bacterium]|jgi:hypothetical protein|nr:hypothetical protein [Candidatus Limnocylindria bacterium]